MRRRLARSKSTPGVIVEQLEALIATGNAIQVEGHPGSYEVTIFDWCPRADGLKNHTHHGGQTLAEAVNRAAATLTKGPVR